jgi:transcriptional regulator with XRE-family HTH domain
MTFSAWFKKTREKKSQTLAQTAEILDIAESTVSRWEQGTTPRVGHLYRICQWAPVSAAKLLALLETP